MIRQRLQQHRPDDTEHRTVGADAKGKRRDGQGSKRRRAAALTQGEAEVVANRLECHGGAPGGVSLVEMPGKGPALDKNARAFGGAGNERVADLIAREQRGAPPRVPPRALEAVDEDPIELAAELLPEPAWIGPERQPVNGARKRDRHRFDSGRSRCARATATWSASRRASALATERPCAVMR